MNCQYKTGHGRCALQNELSVKVSMNCQYKTGHGIFLFRFFELSNRCVRPTATGYTITSMNHETALNSNKSNEMTLNCMPEN
jgi:hypothetical protein